MLRPRLAVESDLIRQDILCQALIVSVGFVRVEIDNSKAVYQDSTVIPAHCQCPVSVAAAFARPFGVRPRLARSSWQRRCTPTRSSLAGPGGRSVGQGKVGVTP